MSIISTVPISQHYRFPAKTGDLVTEIKSDLLNAERTYAKADHYRVRAAYMLDELRERVTAEGKDWWPWAAEHFANVSRRTLERLLQIAAAECPEGIVEQQTRRNRIDKAKSRLTVSRKSKVVKLPTRKQKNLVARALELTEMMTNQERVELKAALKERWQW